MTSTILTASQSPGPSSALFSNPFYSCRRNFYVSTSGNDANAGSATSPWRTIQHADNSSRQAGDCINVQPGTYSAAATISYGGSTASSTGYVVYRCTMLDACTITANTGFRVASNPGPNYVVFDGFKMMATTPVSYGIAFSLGANGSNPANSNHHIWVLNNIIQGFGQSGADMDSGDYIYYVHNVASGNAHVTCDAQGSGFTIVVAKAAPNYTPTADDLEFGPYHIVVAWNVSHDNQLTTCGSAQNPYDTDGNGIIIDDFANQGSSNVLYPHQTIVMGNVSYRNGGAGVLVARSSFVTVVNNTAYSNYQDPFNNGTFRPEIGIGGGTGNMIVGNIAYANPATSPNDSRCQGVNYQRSPWNLPLSCPLEMNAALGAGSGGIPNGGNVLSNNVTFQGTPPYVKQSGNTIWSPDTINCGTGRDANLCNVDPQLVSVSQSNFGLSRTSPAIGNAQPQSLVSFMRPDSGACAARLSFCGSRH